MKICTRWSYFVLFLLSTLLVLSCQARQPVISYDSSLVTPYTNSNYIGLGTRDVLNKTVFTIKGLQGEGEIDWTFGPSINGKKTVKGDQAVLTGQDLKNLNAADGDVLELSVSSGSTTKKVLGSFTYKPLEIRAWQDLQAINLKLDGNYKLMNNIHFPDPGTEGFPEWGFIPIGYSTGSTTLSSKGSSSVYAGDPFKGTLHGNNYQIDNFYINARHPKWRTRSALITGKTLDYSFIGLFGKIEHQDKNTVAIQNIQLILRGDNKNPGISSPGWRIGALVGWLQASVTDVAVEGGGILGPNNAQFYIGALIDYTVGGIVGINEGLVKGYSKVNVQGANGVGGLVGLNYGTVVGYSTGAVIAINVSGGLVGENTGLIVGYALGSVTGNDNLGGLAGTSFPGTVRGYSRSIINGRSNTGGILGLQSSYTNPIPFSTGWSDGNLKSSGTNSSGVVAANLAQVSSGYWDISSVGRVGSSSGAVGISSANNIQYTAGNPAVFTDTKGTSTTKDDETIFTDETFLETFDLPTSSGKWPKLKKNVSIKQKNNPDTLITLSEEMYNNQKTILGW